MKKVLLIILIVIVVLIGICIAVYAYYGGFASIEIKKEKQGGETVVYKSVTGDYSQTGKISDEIYYKLLNDYKIQTYKGFGTYYDNPAIVKDKSKLRSDVGCIIEASDTAKLAEIKEYEVKILPDTNYIFVEFPYKGTLSIFVGMMKVYPALNKYYIENKMTDSNPVTEIYDMKDGKIIYRVVDSENSN